VKKKILEVENLTKHFGGLTAVSELDFAVGEGEILGMIGPNGAGKSTTFQMLTGLITPHAGQDIEALGQKEPASETPRDRQRLIERGVRRSQRSPFASRVGLPGEDLGETRDVAPTVERDTLRIQRLRASGIAGVAAKVAGGPKGESRRPEKPMRAEGWEPRVDGDHGVVRRERLIRDDYRRQARARAMDDITRPVGGIIPVLQDRTGAVDISHPHLERGERRRHERNATWVA